MARLSLHCGKCREELATSAILMLATVPPSQTHVAIKRGKEDVAFESVRKIPNPNPKKISFCPFKIQCRKCSVCVGSINVVEEDELICFKVEDIYFRTAYREEIKDKKLKKIKARLIDCGLEVVNVSLFSKMSSDVSGAGSNERISEPMVYCDKRSLTSPHVRRLTRDEPRGYQLELSQCALQENSLVYLPTGSGKTLIAAMVVSCMKKLNPKKLMVFLTDRIPLVYQQSDYIKSQVPSLRVEILAGDMGRFPGDKSHWIKVVQALRENKVDLLVLTHQILLNFLDEETKVLKMTDISLLVFDEAHHCLGNHNYNQIMRDFYKKTPDRYKPLVLALTASPAGALELEKTQENLNNLLSNLCARACMPVTSSDLTWYSNQPDMSYKIVGLSPKQIELQQVLEDYIAFLRPLIESESWCPGILGKFPVSTPNFRGALRKAMERCSGNKNRARGLALCEHAMHVLSAMEISNILGCEHALGTLGDCLMRINGTATPMERLKKKLVCGSKEWLSLEDTVNRLKDDTCGTLGSDRYQELLGELNAFVAQVQDDPTSRGIVFVKMRKTAYKLSQLLRSIPTFADHLSPECFVGHGSGGEGMAWRGEQEEVLKAFRSGQTKLLVSTSVLEEGLDVPICNLVVRFDSAMTLRALVQSRGRASRRKGSKFIVICVDSKEKEAAEEAAVKEKNMEIAMCNQLLQSPSTMQAERFGCQVQTPDFNAAEIEETISHVKEDAPEEYQELESATVSEENGSPRKKRKYVPQVKATIVNVPVKDGILESQDVVQFVEENFELQSLRPEKEGGSTDVACGKIEIVLEPRENDKITTKEKLFSHMIESWCSRVEGMQTSTQCAQMWMQRSGTPRRQRKQDKPVHVLKADRFVVGNFVNRATFRDHCSESHNPQSTRIALEHDLRKMRVFFYVANSYSRWKADLYQLEMQYSDLEEFVLVDKRKGATTSRVMFTLRHPPRVHKAKGFVEKDQEESTDFEDWYNDDEDYEDWESAGSEVLSISSDDEDDKTKGTEASTPANPEDLLATFDVTSIDAVVNWERVSEVTGMSCGLLGRCLTYAFTLPEQSWPDAKELLSSIARFDKRVVYAPISQQSLPATSISIPRELTFDVKYAVECVLSSHPVIYDRVTTKFGQLLAGKPDDLAIAALHKLGSSLERDKFCDPETKLDSILSQNSLKLSQIPSQLLPEHCAYIKRLVITPTRLLYYAPEIMSKNRVLRNYDPDNFICVNIRDEDFSRLSSAAGTIEKLLERVNRILDEGVRPAEEQFLFLGSSNSQLRNHGCWFVRPNPHPDEIRKWMGDFSQIKNVATYCSRIGQCFSTSMDAVGIDVSEGASWEHEEDVWTADRKYCFSDGVGRISQELVTVVSTKLGWATVPSAIQVRFAGCKGVLALDPTLPGKTAVFRESMRKFESNHRRLEVIQKSRPQAVYLNHQIILLLSNLGVPDEVFMKLQRDMLHDLAGMLFKERLAVRQLMTVASTGIAYKGLSEGGVGLTVEPFFKSLLVALYRERIQNMLSKARVLVPPVSARLMMGVMDDTGVLEPGQVFVQFSPPSVLVHDEDSEFYSSEFNTSDKNVLRGPVVVTRNPCLHPGDVRVLEAVDTPGLSHLVDCVVFPRKGPRPHPSEMAGGDLDGDLYFVCWDQSLLPRKSNVPPMNYEAPPKKKEWEPITVRHMTKFFSEYIRSDQLGVIDNAHKAHADIEEEGVSSARCLELADLHSRAVDAPKIGYWPEMPKEARVSTFPNFMMKSDKPSYQSSKVLGKLYRGCRAFKDTVSEIPLKSANVDPTLLVPEFQTYLQEAENLYDEYKHQLKTLMSLYGIESEAELVTGCFRKLQNRLGREKTEIAEIVSRVLMLTRTTLRRKFFEEFGLDGTRLSDSEVISLAMKRKASAWYYVAYKSAHERKDAADQEQFLSFPWVVYDVMLAIRKGSVKTQGPSNVAASVSKSLMEIFEREKPSLLSGLKERSSTKAVLSKAVQNSCPNLSLALFGSSATLLFQQQSDIDLCILKSDVIAQQSHLETESQVEVLKKLRSVMKKHFRKTRLVDSAQVPVLSCMKPISKKSQPLMRVPCDLSASWGGLLKAFVVSHYIKRHPGFLPTLRMLLRWGQQSGLTGHGKRAAGLNSNLLTFLMLSFCLANGYIEGFNIDSVWRQCLDLSAGQLSDDALLNEWEDVLREPQAAPLLGDTTIGEAVLSFFQTFNATIEKDIPDAFASLLGVRRWDEMLSADNLQLLKEHAQRAFHLLALHADAEVLLSLSASEERRVMLLPQTLSIIIAGNERHNAHELSRKTGARVTIRPKFPGSGLGLVLDAIGSHSAVSAVERELDVLATQALRNKVRFISVLFVDGAKTLVLEGCRSEDEQVSLIPYYGEHHSRNDSVSLFVPLLTDHVPSTIGTGLAFTRHDFQTFQEKFLTQVQVIDKDYCKSIHGDIEFVVHFGRLYVFNVPRAFTEDTEPMSVSVLQANLRKASKPHPASCFPASATRKSHKVKKKPKRVTESDLRKKRKEKPTRSSFYTSVSSREKAESFILKRGFLEVSSSEDYTLDIHSDHEFYVRFDQDLTFNELGYPKIRWCAIDVKRAWQEKADAEGSELDGAEHDVRFMLLSRRAVGSADIRGTDYDKYRDALKPAPHVNATCSFEVKNEIWNDVILVRHRRSRSFRFTPGLTSSLASDFRRSLTVNINNVTEHSRPTREVSKFSKVLSRCEVSVQAELPSNWVDGDEMKKLLRDIWAFAFAFSSEMPS